MTRFGKSWRKIKQDEKTGQFYTSESDLQKSCVQRFHTIHSEFADLLFSIPNGAIVGGLVAKSGHPVAASILVGEGMKKGVPDLFLAFPRAGFHGLFIEMKTIVGSLSKDQRKYLKLFAAKGYAVAVCKTIDEFDSTIESYMKSLFVQTPVWAYKREIAALEKKVA